MELNFDTQSYTLQPNEVLENESVRVTNISKKPVSISFQLMSSIDRLSLAGGPKMENGLEFRLRV